MIKKIALAGVGLTLLASPFTVSAQATISSNASLIAQLTALIQVLEQELQQLIASRASTPTPPQTTSPSFVNLCAAYAHLQKGDTDASTGGQVSQLQSFIGISPATGYYGALTQIGYGNKCIGGNAQPTSVAGMSMYTDSDFGFSFWYPSTMNVNVVSNGSGASNYGNNTKVLKTIAAPAFTIEEVYSPDTSMYYSIDAGPFGSSIDRYYFDSQAHEWMDVSDGGPKGGAGGTSPADISKNTMGGLHILGAYERFGLRNIIPLSANNFLVLSANCNDATDVACDESDTSGHSAIDKFNTAVQTVVATDPSVATPVSTAQQTATISAEASAYGIPTANQTNGTAYTAGLVALTYPSDFTLSQNITAAQKDSTVSYMSQGCTDSATCIYYTGPSIDDVESAFFSLKSATNTTYEDCTNTTANKDTTTQTINGQVWYKNDTGDAGLGHRLTGNTYRTYFNGACYEAYLSIAWNVGTGEGPDQSRFNALQNELTSIMNSVRFVVPQTLPAIHAQALPAWQSFSGTTVPVSFSYPGTLLIYTSEAEVDVGPGTRVGLDMSLNSADAGAIDVQMTPSKYFPAGDSATQAMQANMNTEPIGNKSAYQTISLGNEAAYTRSDTTATGFSVIYVAHASAYYRILLMNPLLPQEYQTFVSSFHFTQ